MSFTGDLEHLSIVDVVQLLHATRKSGTLAVSGVKGVANLVFSDGFIVSASHFDERLKIGVILVEAGALDREGLALALEEQRRAGERRRPLLAALIESGRVRKEDAYRGLETLIELTIVDILTWKTGSFTLDVEAAVIADDYRYFPENLRQELHFHAENVLMEALRIYDEKKRDGRLAGEPAAAPAPAAAAAPRPAGRAVPAGGGEDFAFALTEEDDAVALTEEASVALSADDLGLEGVEGLARRIPEVFAPLQDRPAPSPHRSLLRLAAPGLAAEDREAIAAYLEGLAGRPPALAAASPPAVILLGAEALLAHCLPAVLRHEGFAVLTTTDPEDVAPFAEQHRGRGLVPLLVVDRAALARAGHAFGAPPQLGAVELAAPDAPASPDGVRAVLALPRADGAPGEFARELVAFLERAPAALQRHLVEQASFAAAAALRCAGRLRGAADPAAVVQAVLASVVDLGARACALFVRGGELVSGRDAALHLPGGGRATLAGVRIPLGGAPLLRQAVETGQCRLVPAADAPLRDALAAAGGPADPLTLLLPIAASGRTAAVICGDFGAAAALPPPVELLETFAAQAVAALEGILGRRQGKPHARES